MLNLTLRKFLHWRQLKFLFVLGITGICTVVVLSKRASSYSQTSTERLTLDCAKPVRELSCSIPAFTAEWSMIPGVDIKIYSAHLDYRIKDDSGVTQLSVRTIALLRKSALQMKFYCIVNYPSGGQKSARAYMDKIWLDSWDNASHKDLLTPHILSCHLGDATESQPSSVSIVTDVCACPSNKLRLRKLNRYSKQGDFAVCVKGLFYTEPIYEQLVQWIEMMFLLGAKHIHFYEYHLHRKTKKLLKFYQKFRNVSVQKLTLPPPDYPRGKGYLKNFLETRIWEKRRLELVPYNDCYYSLRDKYKYVVLLDIDEIIVPREPNVTTWTGLVERIRDVESEAIGKYASFAFSNIYFFRGGSSVMDVLRQTERSANLSKPGFAVKSFFSSEGSLAVFNHYTLIPLKADIRKCAIVGSDVALVHHYRDSCPAGMLQECKDNFMKYKVKDLTILKYDVKLRQALEQVKVNIRNSMFAEAR